MNTAVSTLSVETLFQRIRNCCVWCSPHLDDSRKTPSNQSCTDILCSVGSSSLSAPQLSPSFRYVCLALNQSPGHYRKPAKMTSASAESEVETKLISKPEFSPTRRCPTLCFAALRTVCFEFASYHPTCVLTSSQLLIVVTDDSLKAGIERWGRHSVVDASGMKLHR